VGLNPFVRREDSYRLAVSMTGVKMGDRLVQVGCADEGRLAAVAEKVGLSGHAVAVVPDERSAARVSKGAARAGVLVDVQVAPPTDLPIDDGSFDLAVVDDTGGMVGSMASQGRAALVRGVGRVLRPGGRMVFIGSSPRGRLGALLAGGASAAPPVAPADAAAILEAGGFTLVRTLGERDGLVFVEGIKPRGTS
jgi:SAM-dependent methyltransferase